MSPPGGWAGSDRRSELPGDWDERVAAVMARDRRRCRWRLPSGRRCPREATDVDHVIPGDDHRLSNLQALCGPHHDAKTSVEGNTAKRRAPKKRTSEAHPGARR